MKRLAKTVLISLAAAICGMHSVAYAQSTPTSAVTPEMRVAANEAYQKQEWTLAAERYENIIRLEPQNAGANYRHGVSLLNQNMNDGARASLAKAFSISPNAVFALALARVYARLGMKDDAYKTFEAAIPLGGISAESLNGEKDFAAMKTEAKFVDLAKKLDAAANPCRSRPEYRQFDFWIGEWLPKNPQGVTVGTSSIQSILGGCIIFENWETPVSAGKSFNLFDATDGKWHQTWVDAKGTMTNYVGGLQDGKMVLVSESVTNGKKTLGRMTFSKLADGSVRQLGENSTDDGKTWTTSFDFTYVRKP